MNEFGNTIVHAPSDNALRITTPARTIASSNTFIDLEDDDYLEDSEDMDIDEIERRIENERNNLYAFLNK
jgi:hypothetical protein